LSNQTLWAIRRIDGPATARHASLTCPALIAAPIALVCRPAGPVGVLKRVAPAETAVAPKRGHALVKGIKTTVRSAAFVAVLSAPRRSRGCIGAQNDSQKDGCHREGAHDLLLKTQTGIRRYRATECVPPLHYPACFRVRRWASFRVGLRRRERLPVGRWLLRLARSVSSWRPQGIESFSCPVLNVFRPSAATTASHRFDLRSRQR
jgi:hypothetical protein